MPIEPSLQRSVSCATKGAKIHDSQRACRSEVKLMNMEGSSGAKGTEGQFTEEVGSSQLELHNVVRDVEQLRLETPGGCEYVL